MKSQFIQEKNHISIFFIIVSLFNKPGSQEQPPVKPIG